MSELICATCLETVAFEECCRDDDGTLFHYVLEGSLGTDPVYECGPVKEIEQQEQEE